jgi:hypothetical protein
VTSSTTLTTGISGANSALPHAKEWTPTSSTQTTGSSQTS